MLEFLRATAPTGGRSPQWSWRALGVRSGGRVELLLLLILLVGALLVCRSVCNHACICSSCRNRASMSSLLSPSGRRSSTSRIGRFCTCRTPLSGICPTSSIFDICTICPPVRGRMLRQPLVATSLTALLHRPSSMASFLLASAVGRRISSVSQSTRLESRWLVLPR